MPKLASYAMFGVISHTHAEAPFVLRSLKETVSLTEITFLSTEKSAFDALTGETTVITFEKLSFDPQAKETTATLCVPVVEKLRVRSWEVATCTPFTYHLCLYGLVLDELLRKSAALFTYIVSGCEKPATG